MIRYTRTWLSIKGSSWTKEVFEANYTEIKETYLSLKRIFQDDDSNSTTAANGIAQVNVVTSKFDNTCIDPVENQHIPETQIGSWTSTGRLREIRQAN